MNSVFLFYLNNIHRNITIGCPRLRKLIIVPSAQKVELTIFWGASMASFNFGFKEKLKPLQTSFFFIVSCVWALHCG